MSQQPPQQEGAPPPQILQRPPGQSPPPPQQQQHHVPPPTQPPQQQMQQMSVEGGRGRGNIVQTGGRSGGRGRGPPSQQGRGGRGGQGRGGQQPISLNPSSGIPYGHVPAYLPGSASLVEQLDQRVLIVLRDGKHIIGQLASFDQFSNMICQDAVERRFHRSKSPEGTVHYYCDIPLGVYVIRGDSVVILGAVNDMGANNNSRIQLKEISLEELQQMEEESAKEKEEEDIHNGPLTWDFDTDLIA